MKRLAVLAGLATLSLATPTQAAEKTCDTWISGKRRRGALQGGQPQATPQRTPQEQAWWDKNCGYGGANTKDPRCAQIEGGGSKQGTGTDWQPPPTKPPPGQDQASGQRCPPGTTLLRYGSRYRCVRRGGTPGQDQAGSGCQPGWIWSSRLYRCVPGTIPGSAGGTGTAQGRRTIRARQVAASAATARSGVIASTAAYHSGPAAALMAAMRAATAAAPASAGPKAAIAAFPVAVAVAASIST